MFRLHSLPIGGQAVIAAIVGSACGTTAALLSVGPHPGSRPGVQASPTAVASPAPATAGAVAEVRAAPPTTVSVPVPADPDGQDVKLRARALATRPDVKALVALRESVVRHAAERGETEAEASKQLLDDLDRYLESARELRLKLDAEELRHARATGSQPR